jgi:hypothetical protein
MDPDSSLTEYLAAINSRVFFWASAERLDRLRQAKEYRTEEQVVLHVDTRALVERHGPRIELCRLNSGAVTQKNHPLRGHRSWLPIADYPYDEYRRRHGLGGALVEVTVLDAVPDILDLTDKIEGHHRLNPTPSQPQTCVAFHPVDTGPCSVPSTMMERVHERVGLNPNLAADPA